MIQMRISKLELAELLSIGWMCVALLLFMTSCSADKVIDNPPDSSFTSDSYIGKPIEIILNIEREKSNTRAVTALITGTAWLNGGSTLMKPYVWNGSIFTSTDPLVWTGMNMSISGYYAGANGQIAVSNDLGYSIDYSSSSVDGNFLAGQTTASYRDQTRVAITLRQQLARVYVMVRSEGGAQISNAKLDNIYTAGTFCGGFDSNGYATGGTDGSGWTVSGNTSIVSMSEVEGQSNTYQAFIIPQTVNTGSTFFSVLIDGLTAQFKLASTTTFKAGRQYFLQVDELTKILYVSTFLIDDFADASSITSANVTSDNVVLE